MQLIYHKIPKKIRKKYEKIKEKGESIFSLL